jgi:type II secretory pathway component GspD/PulD (secretin)
MRNELKLLLAGALIAGVAFAQEQSESVQKILDELARRQGREPAAATAEEVPTIEDAAETAVPEAEVVTVEAAEGEELPEIDMDAVMGESRALYVGGEFEKAQRGFEAIIKRDPENMMARMYLRRLMERDQRKVEVKGMKEVDAAWSTGLVQRSYSVSGAAVEKMRLQDIEESMDVTVKFPEVDFPKGAMAVYQPKQEKLFVRNTRDNLQVLEEILDAMDIHNTAVNSDQVEIEAKFIEVAEGTLEQLGFEWRNPAGSPDISTGIEGNDVVIPGGQRLFDDALRGGPGNATGMPFNQPNDLADGNEVVAPAGMDWTAFRFEDTFSANPDFATLEHRGSTPLDILISALDQTSGTDVLSAPRVVTKSGETATIRAGQLHYFPEVYEVGADEGTIMHVRYEDFVEKLLGVELEVTPKVNGGQIEMALNPRITELSGWQNYTVAPADSAYNHWQGILRMKYYHDPIVARLPIFKRREIDTEATIADGGSIGMGGLINEKVESYEDKVPFLGSMPLVGRLFRNEGERRVKRNLMIFVTANKIDPSGRISTARSFE